MGLYFKKCRSVFGDICAQNHIRIAEIDDVFGGGDELVERAGDFRSVGFQFDSGGGELIAEPYQHDVP